MEVSAATIKALREKTGAGFMDCKKALAESGGDLDAAVDYLRRKGLAAAAKKAGRTAAEGAIGAYIHAGGKIGVLVELNCETDFVARTAEFQALLKDLAMQVAAGNPKYIAREDIPRAELEREREIYRSQSLDAKKPQAVIDKIVEGKLGRYYSEVCLLDQPFIKDPDKKVNDLIQEAIARLQENIVVRRFVRFQLGDDGERP
ncbi:MAG TPA: translation elongation factor Ts [Candidatus Acidoferrales bacterium]|nr:translation elongation factor Ts [Candidatus Acidoferrales bacterium]